MTLVVTAIASTAASAPPLRFETVFAIAGEPAALHFHATYGPGPVRHRLEVWRDGDRRLKRVTDGGLTTLVDHRPGGPDFRLTVIDPAKRIVSTINRSNLYRLGNFSDWFDLGHGLRHPTGQYRLVAGHAPVRAVHPVGPCAWYDLTVAARTTHVCWAADVRLPLVIAAADGTPVWQVTATDHVVPPAVFRVATAGYVRVDADQDIGSD